MATKPPTSIIMDNYNGLSSGIVVIVGLRNNDQWRWKKWWWKLMMVSHVLIWNQMAGEFSSKKQRWKYMDVMWFKMRNIRWTSGCHFQHGFMGFSKPIGMDATDGHGWLALVIFLGVFHASSGQNPRKSFHWILVENGIPRSWIIILPDILGSRIPQLIINQQGFWTR